MTIMVASSVLETKRLDNDNVVYLNTDYVVGVDNDTNTVTVDGVVNGILNNDLVDLFVVGVDSEGELYLAGTAPSLSKFVYMIERAKLVLLQSEFEHG